MKNDIPLPSFEISIPKDDEIKQAYRRGGLVGVNVIARQVEVLKKDVENLLFKKYGAKKKKRRRLSKKIETLREFQSTLENSISALLGRLENEENLYPSAESHDELSMSTTTSPLEAFLAPLVQKILDENTGQPVYEIGIKIAMAAYNLGFANKKETNRLVLGSVNFALDTVSEGNKREHDINANKRHAVQKQTTLANLSKFGISQGKWWLDTNKRLVVKIVRVATKELDSDNLLMSQKYVRDAIAYWFGVDDSPKGPISWEYGQRVDRSVPTKQVEITIYKAEP